MRNNNLKTALSTLRKNRWRSILTMSGIIIGVLAVITIVSIGLGVKKQLTGQVVKLKQTVISITPGAGDSVSANNVLTTGSLSSTGLGSLNNADLTTIQQTSNISLVIPIGISSGFASVNGHRLPGGAVIATSADLPTVLNHHVEFGNFFTSEEAEQNAVVIGTNVASQLFEEQSPIGRTLKIRGQDFTVRGVFEDFNDGFLPIGVDLNKAVFIPYLTAQSVSDGPVPITEVFVQAKSADRVPGVINDLQQRLNQAHGGQSDFSALTATAAVKAGSHTVDLLTQMITGVAAISLLVGGLGIINIMLVSVTERTHEIGVRKAIGATNRQILHQFLIEAAVLSAVGGIIGVLLALTLNFIIVLSTDLHPVLYAPVVIIVPILAWLLGVLFGVIPAVRAAHKDPIESLRYE